MYHFITVHNVSNILDALKKSNFQLKDKARVDEVDAALGEVLKRMPEESRRAEKRAQRMINGKISRSIVRTRYSGSSSGVTDEDSAS